MPRALAGVSIFGLQLVIFDSTAPHTAIPDRGRSANAIYSRQRGVRKGV
jgi:hypothetical protein